MPYERDPLSVRYDATARQSVMRAIRAARDGRGVQVWVASTRGELASPDEGGRTAHERAFSRAAYYLVWRAPINAGQIPDWSLKLIWGPDSAMQASSHGRMARPVRLRIWPRRGPKGGRDHAYAMPVSRQWARNEDLRSGGQGSPFQRFPLPVDCHAPAFPFPRGRSRHVPGVLAPDQVRGGRPRVGREVILGLIAGVPFEHVDAPGQDLRVMDAPGTSFRVHQVPAGVRLGVQLDPLVLCFAFLPFRCAVRCHHVPVGAVALRAFHALSLGSVPAFHLVQDLCLAPAGVRVQVFEQPGVPVGQVVIGGAAQRPVGQDDCLVGRVDLVAAAAGMPARALCALVTADPVPDDVAPPVNHEASLP